MAGIYIHIPFCKQACNYCNFHFSTSLLYKNELLQAIIHELELRKKYLGNQKIETIYFGGGTPSLLTADELKQIFEKIDSSFNVQADAEITIEANPDDITKNYLTDLKTTPINRFSMGVQSFADEDLQWMNRAHNAQQADYAIKAAQDFGFTNISIDLIYGTPTTTNLIWKKNLQTAIDLNIPHISAYSLTVEPGTPLAKQIKLEQKQNPANDLAAAQMDMLIEKLCTNGFEHYEISNFAKPDWYAKHNTNYWRQVHYLGVGPSAHSFNGDTRSWNVANNNQYIEAIKENKLPQETEQLSLQNKYNEWLMTGLRTQWGCNLHEGEIKFGKEIIQKLKNEIEPLIEEKLIQLTSEKLFLTHQGKFFADKIMSDLFWVE